MADAIEHVDRLTESIIRFEKSWSELSKKDQDLRQQEIVLRQRTLDQERARSTRDTRLDTSPHATTKLDVQSPNSSVDRSKESAHHAVGHGGGSRFVGLSGLRGAAGLSTAIAGAYLAKSVADRSTAAVNLFSNQDVPFSKRQQEFSESIPVIGSFIRSLREFNQAIDGTTEAVRQLGVKLNERRTAIPIEEHAITRERGIGLGISEAQFRAAAIGANPLPNIPSFDRTTLGGRQAYADFQHRLAANNQVVITGRKGDAARQAAALAQQQRQQALGRYNASQMDYNAALGRRNAFERNPLTGGNAAGLLGMIAPFSGIHDQQRDVETATGLNVATQRLHSSNQAFQEADREARAKNTEAIRAEGEARRAVVERLRSEFEVLQAREQRIAGNAARFGGMDPAQRVRSRLAFNAYQAAGGDLSKLPFQFQNDLAAINPALLQAAQERSGERDPFYQELRRRGAFGTDTESLAEIRGRMDRAQQAIQVTTQFDSHKLAVDIAKNLSHEIGELIAAIRAEVTNALREQRANVALQNANR